MSVDIDWSLLSGSSALADGLVAALNTQLNTAARPSFLGPVTVTSFDFGTAGPSVEIKDVRDVWRAFDEGDDEGDAMQEAASASECAYDYDEDYYHHDDHLPRGQGHRSRAGSGSHALVPSSSAYLPHNGARTTGTSTPSRPYGVRHASTPLMRTPIPLSFTGGVNMHHDDDNESVYSMGSRSRSVASVGMGLGLNNRRFTSSQPYAYASHPHSNPHPHTRPRSRSHMTPTPSGQRSAARSVEPPGSPPARGVEDPNVGNSSIPPVQMHLRVEHAADMSLTLQTSLQINYPSQLFMSLPLKLVITGLTIAADVVIAYSSRKHRVHITIVDEEGTPGVGQRILPHLHIESEIGHTDAHVLRNVGKVERFIVDVLRKTLVEELVFPNFHTIVL